MSHKFKIGAVVNYRPKDRVISAPRGTYIITGLDPCLRGSSPNIALDISVKSSSGSQWKASCRPASLNMARDDDDPRAPYNVYERKE